MSGVHLGKAGTKMPRVECLAMVFQGHLRVFEPGLAWRGWWRRETGPEWTRKCMLGLLVSWAAEAWGSECV